MKIVRIDGGLGNQMFCYAFAVALREVSGGDVLLDSHRYKFFPNHVGYELSNLFDIKMREASNRELWRVTNVAYSVFMSRLLQFIPKRKTEIVENFCHFDETLLMVHPDGYYIGNWQCYKYFDRFKGIILNELSFKDKLDAKNQELETELCDSGKSISLHIRRGDYLNDPKYLGICDLQYYKRAIAKAVDMVGGNPVFAIFSNDIDWCKINILPLCPEAGKVIFVDWNKGVESYKDMRLMSVCRVNVIANSSFSWWAAYMNQRDDRYVISPSKWINLPLEYRIQCDEWDCI